MAPALPQSADIRGSAGRAFAPPLGPRGVGVIPGEYLLGEGDIEANVGRRTLQLTVANTGDRPIQVGSHFHFFEANKALRFDRVRSFGMRLNVPAGTAVRFEPGDEKGVTLDELAGAAGGHGLHALPAGAGGEGRRDAGTRPAVEGGVLGAGAWASGCRGGRPPA